MRKETSSPSGLKFFTAGRSTFASLINHRFVGKKSFAEFRTSPAPSLSPHNILLTRTTVTRKITQTLCLLHPSGNIPTGKTFFTRKGQQTIACEPRRSDPSRRGGGLQPGSGARPPLPSANRRPAPRKGSELSHRNLPVPRSGRVPGARSVPPYPPPAALVPQTAHPPTPQRCLAGFMKKCFCSQALDAF